MRLAIGVEAIGMRYVASVASLEDGTIVAGGRELCDALGLHTTQRDDFRQRLYNTIRGLCSRVRYEGVLQDIALCIGLSGVNYEHDSRVELPEELRRCNLQTRELICTGDIEIVLASHVAPLTKSASGIICNMGSTAFARNDLGEITRVGGWGPAIGDDGSGYEMGKLALRAIGDELDRGESASLLWSCISEWLAKGDDRVGAWYDAACEWRCHLAQFAEKMGAVSDPRRAMCAFVHRLELQGSWRPVASGLTVPLMKASEQGDKQANRIIQIAARALADQHLLAIARARLTQFQPVILYGGVLTHNKIFRDAVSSALESAHKRPVEVLGAWNSRNAMRPAVGALLYALGGSTSGRLRFPSWTVVERVQSTYRAKAEELDIVND